MKAISLTMLLLLTFISCNKSKSSSSGTGIINNAETSKPIPGSLTEVEEFMELINNHRRNLGLVALAYSEVFEDVARVHSENMANGTVPFGHEGFSDRCREIGATKCAENVASGYKTAQAVFNG